MNKVILTGRLTHSPELRLTQVLTEQEKADGAIN